MKIIKPSAEFFGEVPTDYENAIRFIEMAGRTCYKSEDKITADSAESFVRRLIKAGHLAMVEHSNFVVRIDGVKCDWEFIDPPSKYHTVIWYKDDFFYIGGNLTAWFNVAKEVGPIGVYEPFWMIYGGLFGLSPKRNVIEYPEWHVCPHAEIPRELHRYSAKFVCDRGVSHELVRHRPCSFAQESTRYVNYAGKDMEFIEPAGYENWHNGSHIDFEELCQLAEQTYESMVDAGDRSPQQARAVLPNALKTEIVVTADAEEWRHIRRLRTDKAAHPDMQRVMNMMPWDSFL